MSAPTSYKRLHGVAIVTGAGSGIGRAIAIALSVAGVSTVIIIDINHDGLKTTQDAILSLNIPDPPIIKAITGDISDPSFVLSVFSPLSRLDYAVNCAGIMGPQGRTTEIEIEEFDKINSINYRALWLCEREELKLMLKNEIKPHKSLGISDSDSKIRGQRGAIVNIASQLGLVGKTEAATYTASKAAVLSLTRSDSIDYSKPPHYIRINSICPGVIQTPLTTGENGGVSESMEAAVKIAPMERMGLPSEVADAAVWLCSGESSFVTGTGLVVDGGYVIN